MLLVVLNLYHIQKQSHNFYTACIRRQSYMVHYLQDICACPAYFTNTCTDLQSKAMYVVIICLPCSTQQQQTWVFLISSFITSAAYPRMSSCSRIQQGSIRKPTLLKISTTVLVSFCKCALFRVIGGPSSIPKTTRQMLAASWGSMWLHCTYRLYNTSCIYEVCSKQYLSCMINVTTCIPS